MSDGSSPHKPAQPLPVKRTRKGGTKSRRGCPTCKIRHVKCDETRPQCKQCTSTGRKCEGFQDPGSTCTQLVVAPGRNVNNPDLSEKEGHHLNLFDHLFSSGILGFLKTPRWASLVLQAVHEEPAVRHAAIAFSALQVPLSDHLQLQTASNPGSFALEQYAKTVRKFHQLLSRADKRSVEAALICSVLCICFEILEGSYELAGYHVENALRVLSTTNVDKDLVRVFSRMDVQASTFAVQRIPQFAPRSEDDFSAFQTLEDAEDRLYEMLNLVWGFVRQNEQRRQQQPGPLPLYLVEESQDINRRLEDWNSTLSGYIDVFKSSMTAKEVGHVALLQVHYLAAILTLVSASHAEELIYDAYDDHFRLMCDLADGILRGKLASLSAKAFSMEMGIVLPLTIVVRKCRHVDIRRRAIKLLHSSTHVEGVWDGPMWANIGEQAVEIEEEGLDTAFLRNERVPEFRRIHFIFIDVNPKARATIVTYSLRPNGPDGEWDHRKRLVQW